MNVNTIAEPATEKLTGWLDQLIAMLPNIIAALVVLVLFWIAAKVAKQLLESAVNRMAHNPQVAIITSRVAYIAVLAGGLMVALGILQLEKTVTSLLAGAGIVGLAIGFACQDLAANLMSGFLLATSEPLNNGDLIKTGGFYGTVEKVHLRYSIIRTFEGQLVRIPNRQIFENSLVNYTKPGERRVDFTVGVSYGDDLEKARDIAVEAVTEVEERDTERDVEVYYTEFGDSSVNFSLRFWIEYPGQDYLKARSDAIVQVKKAFDENGITIPFPIRTLDFGIVGGEKLSDVVPFDEIAGKS